ncbi:tetratricopeptide repeat protein [Limnoglobus roseus]|uniref:Tetratricopeptide repeat protein n=1 Tax=Limnoglobus roseus TaxID=2598579 RepID=A0A5C1AH34_9BACT|nr:tetratricopeptide repeat protein [Limnoglobus roseus]QEL18120.1 tetratricopeptide repeat protein [Limnoglobus roseus]
MPPILREYLLKGVFLALWAYLALVLPPSNPDWSRFGVVLAFAGGGLALGLIAGAAVQVRRGLRPSANPAAFPLVVLLESPYWIYAGLILGLAVGLVSMVEVRSEEPITGWLAYFVVGGAILGYGFFQLRQVKEWLWRFLFGAVIGAILVYLAIDYLEPLLGGLTGNVAKRNFSIVLLAGLPFFYLLTFCGEAEESEVEIAAICAALGIGLYLFGLESGLEQLAGKLILLAPLIVYFVYATRILPGLRIFKHTLRGYSAIQIGDHLSALLWFKQALRLDSRNDLARQGMLTLHHQVDVTKLPPDSEILKHLDYGFCLDQATAYLIGGRAPSPVERAKADRLLALVEQQSPRLAARVDYLRIVSLAHAKQFDEAAGLLGRLLSPETPYEAAVRQGVLFPAWDLALRLHPELVKRLGGEELAKPGRRMEAIAATERQLAAEPNDATAAEMKAILYASLTEAEFVADAASGLPTEFNYDYAEQLGLALVDQADAVQQDRGSAFLRIAGRGLPQRGPTIFKKLADIATAAGRTDEARGYLEQVKRSGVLAGPKALTEDQRAIYFTTLRQLSADAEARGDYENAIGDLRLYQESGKNALEGYRKLADLYEKNKDAPNAILNALLMTETGLIYNATDRDFLARKDKYYFNVGVENLREMKDKVERFFDVDYCSRKAKLILDQRDVDADSLDWALHLVRLAKVMKPQDTAVRLAEARCLLRQGDRDAALFELENIREQKVSGATDEDAWYDATRTLGNLYLNELNRPDLAVHCFLDYRDYSKSGADTLFNIARCYEGMNETRNAIKFYEAVTAYEEHPKYWDAKQAMDRLKDQPT